MEDLMEKLERAAARAVVGAVVSKMAAMAREAVARAAAARVAVARALVAQPPPQERGGRQCGQW